MHQYNRSSNKHAAANNGFARYTVYQRRCANEKIFVGGQDAFTTKPLPPEYWNGQNWFKNPCECAVSIAELLVLHIQVSNIVFTVELTCKLQILYGPTKTVVRTATCFSDVGAGVNLIRSFMITDKRRYLGQWNKLLALFTATK